MIFSAEYADILDYFANFAFLIQDYLWNLLYFVKFEEILMHNQDIYGAIIKAIQKKASEILPSGSRVALYGSRARGDARPGSDWDLHILIQGEEKAQWDKWDKYAWPFEEMGMFEFNETINARLYSFSGWLKRSFLPFYQNVENDKIVIFQN